MAAEIGSGNETICSIVRVRGLICIHMYDCHSDFIL